MPRQEINIGAIANDGTGDPIRECWIKVNQMTDEIYTTFGNGVVLSPPSTPVSDPEFKPSVVTGTNQNLDLDGNNFFQGGSVTADITLVFDNVPTEYNWRWVGTIDAAAISNNNQIGLPASVVNSGNIQISSLPGVTAGQYLTLEFYTLDGGTTVHLIRRELA